VLIAKLKIKFLTKFTLSSNVLCQMFADFVHAESALTQHVVTKYNSTAVDRYSINLLLCFCFCVFFCWLPAVGKTKLIIYLITENTCDRAVTRGAPARVADAVNDEAFMCRHE